MNKVVYYTKGVDGLEIGDLVFESLGELDRYYNGVLGIETESTFCNLQVGLARVYAHDDFKQIQILNNTVYFRSVTGEIYGKLIKLNKHVDKEVNKERAKGTYKVVKRCVAEDLVRMPAGKRVLEEAIKQQNHKNEKVKDTVKHIIYTTEYDVDEYIEQHKEDAEELGIDINDREDCELGALENNQIWLEAEQYNLPHNRIGMIVGIAKIGRWDGQKTGFAEYENISIADLLPKMLGRDGDTEIYVENGELKAKQTHHDGTNYIIYREVINIELWSKLRVKLYNQQTFSREELNKCTRSLYSYVAKVYGW